MTMPSWSREAPIHLRTTQPVPVPTPTDRQTTGQHKIVLPEQHLPLLVNGLVDGIQESYRFLDKRAAAMEKTTRAQSMILLILVLMLALQIATLVVVVFLVGRMVQLW